MIFVSFGCDGSKRIPSNEAFVLYDASLPVLLSLQVAMILLPLAFVYDVFWVFIEPMIFSGPSVMVKVCFAQAWE